MRKSALIAPLTGALFVAVSIVSFAIAGEPPDVTDASQREIVDFYSDNSDEIKVGSVLAALAGVLLVYFGAYLRRALQALGGEDDYLPAVAFAGTIAMAIGLAIDGTINFALADAIEKIEPTSAEALLALWNNDFLPMLMGMVLFLTATGISVLRHGGLPKWIGWVAIILAVLAMTPIGFVAFFGGALLIALISILLTLRARSPRPVDR